MVLAERTHNVARELLTHIAASDPYSVFNHIYSKACAIHARKNANPTDVARVDGLLSAIRNRRPYMLYRLERASRELACLVPNALESFVVRLEQLLFRAADVNLSNIAANNISVTSGPAFREACEMIVSEVEAAGEPVSSAIVPYFSNTFNPLIDDLCKALTSESSSSQYEELKAAVLALMHTCIQWISEIRTTATIPGSGKRVGDLSCSWVSINPISLRTLSPFLGAASNTRDLEVPGQYYVQGEPSHRRRVLISYMHPELFRLSSATRFLRRVGFIGNNGKAYFYHVVTSLHCPEEEWCFRDASRDQLVRAVSSALRTEVCARSRGVFLRPPTSVAMSDTVQLVNLPLVAFSFWQMFEYWARNNPRVDASLMTDSNALQQSMIAPHYQPLITATENAGETTTLLTTLYNEVPDHVVRDCLTLRCSSLEARFELVRCFRLNLVARSALDLLLSTHASAMPQLIVIPDNPTSGAESLNYYAPYTGVKRCDAQPGVVQPRLRLTRNVMSVLGEPGGFSATKDALVATLLSLQIKREKLALFLRMHYLNEYNIDAVLKPSAAPPQQNDDHHTARIRHDAALARLDALCPRKFAGLTDEQRVLQTDANVTKLMEEAMAPSNIVSFQHSWYPWV